MKARIVILLSILLICLFSIGLAEEEIELQDGVIDLRTHSVQVVEDRGALILQTQEALSVGDRVWLGEHAYRVIEERGGEFVVVEIQPPEYMKSISVHQRNLPISGGEGSSSEIVSEAGVKVTANSVYVTQTNSFTANFNIGGVKITVPLNMDGEVGLDFEYDFLKQELKELRYTSNIKVHGTVKIEAALQGSPDGFSVPIGRVIFYTNGAITIGGDVWAHITLSGEGNINYSASVYSNITYDPITGKTDHDSSYDHDVSFDMHGKASLGVTCTPFLRILGLGKVLSVPIYTAVTGTFDMYLDEKYQCADLNAWVDMSAKATISIFILKFDFELFKTAIPITEKHFETNGAGKWMEVATCIRDLVPEKEKVYCTLYFDTDGGTPIAPMVVEKGMPIEELPVTTKPGYVFSYWFGGDAASSFSPHNGIMSDKTIKAIWLPANDPDDPQDPEKPENSSDSLSSGAVFFLNDGYTDDQVVSSTYYYNSFSLNKGTLKDVGNGVVVLPVKGETVTGYFREATPIAWDKDLRPIAFSFSYVTKDVTLSSVALPEVPVLHDYSEVDVPYLDVGSAHTVIVRAGTSPYYHVYGNNLQTVIIESGASINFSYMFINNPKLKTVIVNSGASISSNCAFKNNPSLETIYMEDGVVVSGPEVFAKNPSLTSVRLPQNWTSTPYGIFTECTSLKSVLLPKSLTSVGEEAFSRCSSLESIVIPEDVTVVDAGAFAYCDNLRKVEFNNKLERIEQAAFHSTALHEIDLPSSLTYLGNGAFGWCHSLTEVDMPDSITKVGIDIFSCCENLERVKLPRNLGLVQSGMFQECAKLKEIVWPEPTYIIGEYAFCRSGFERLDVPATVTQIYPYAFHSMKNLTTLTLPPYVTRIGEYAFGEYPLLKELVLPEGMTTIKYEWGSAIEESPSLRLLVLPSTFEYPDKFLDHPYDREYYDFELVMRDGPTSIGSDAFAGENLLFRTLEIPSTIETIGSHSFCDMPLLGEITLPEAVREIGYGSFCSNPSLKKVTILNRDLYPSGCFLDCAEDLVIRGYHYSGAEWFAMDYGFKFEPIDEEQVQLRWTTDGMIFQSRMVTSGELLTGMTSPAAPGKIFTGWFTDSACSNMWRLATDVVPPEGLTLWAGWTKVSEEDFTFRLEDDGTLTVIQCVTKASSVEIPSQAGSRKVSRVAAGAFDGAPTRSLTVPASVTLDQGAFMNAQLIEKVNFESGSAYAFTNGLILEDAGKTLFYALESARQPSMTLPEGIVSIKTAAFWGKNAPASLIIPTTLTTLEPMCFQDNATQIYSVKHIESVSAYAEENGLRYNLYPVTYMRGDQVWLTDEAQAYLPLTIAVLPYEEGMRYGWYTDPEGKQPWTAGANMPDAPLTLYAIASPLFATSQNPDESLTITGYLGKETRITVPVVLNGKLVTALGANVFPYAAEITLPDSIASIAKGAFASGCTIIADEGSPAQVYANQNGLAFKIRLYELSFVTNSTPKSSVTLPKGAELPLDAVERYGYAFAGWFTDKALTKAAPATMPAGDLTLYAAWVESSETIEYEIRMNPDGSVKLMRYLGSESDVSIPAALGGRKVTAIGESAFSNCATITSVEVPAGITLIEDYAFSGCTSLKVAVLGEGVTDFPANLFSGCTSLEAVIMQAENAAVYNNMFFNSPIIYTTRGSGTFNNLQNTNNYYDSLTSAGRALRMYTDSWICVVDEPRQMNFVQYWPLGGGDDIVDWQFDPADKGEGLGNNRFVARKLGEHIVYGTVDGHTYKMSSVACYRANHLLFTSYQDEATELVFYYPDDAFASDMLEIPASVQGLPVTGIDAYSIYENDQLRTVVLSDTITYLGDYSIAYCYNLRTLYVPSSVTGIGANVFEGCYNVTVYCHEGSAMHTYAQEKDLNFKLVSDQAFTYEVTEDGAVITGFDGFQANIAIPQELDGYPVVGLGNAFNGNQFIHTVTLPEGLVYLADNAFSNSSIASVTFPSTLETIGTQAFYSCSNLESVSIPATVQTLGDQAFQQCENLKEVVLGAKTIGNAAFSSCYSLSSLTLLPGVEHIGDNAFSGLSLTSVTLPDTVVSLGSYAFSNNALEDIALPDSVKTLGDYAFYSNDLKNITFSSSLTEIGNHAFAFNELESISLPGSVKTLGDYAFYLNSLKNVSLSSGLMEIGAYAFSNNSALESVILPDSVTSLGAYAFDNCRMLRSVKLSGNLTAISDHAFANCENLKSIILPRSVTSIGASAFRWSGLTDITLNDGLTSIGEYAFYYTKLDSILLPESVTNIGSYAFDGANIEEISLPSHMTEINYNVIPYDCAIVCEPDSNAYDIAYRYGYQMKYRYNGQTTFFILDVSGETCKVTGYLEREPKSIEIPSKICGYTVTSIDRIKFRQPAGVEEIIVQEGITELAAGAFANLPDLTRLYLPDSLSVIGERICASFPNVTIYATPGSAAHAYALANGAKFKPLDGTATNDELTWTVNGDGASVTLTSYAGSESNVVLPEKIDGYTVTAISGLFSGNDKLVSIKIPDTVVSIGEKTFYGCTNLKSIQLPGGLTEIGESAFDNCASLTSIELPTSIREIGDMAFWNTRLSRVYLPTKINTIGSNAFPGVTTLVVPSGTLTSAALGTTSYVQPTTLVLPSGIKQVKAGAFTGVDAEMVIIPDNCTIIGDKAFANNPNLHYISLPANVETIPESAVSGSPVMEFITR